MNENKAFLMFYDYIRQFDLLTDEQIGKLMRMILYYVNGRPVCTDDCELALRLLFSMMTATIDKGNEKFEETRKRRSDAAKERERTKKAQRCTECHAVQDCDEEETKEEKEEEIYEVKETEPPSLSDIPTFQEVEDYCRKRGNKTDPRTFVEYYNAKGWKHGSSDVADWKALVRLWEKRELNGKKPSPEVPEKAERQMSEFEKRTYERYRALAQQSAFQSP